METLATNQYTDTSSEKTCFSYDMSQCCVDSKFTYSTDDVLNELLSETNSSEYHVVPELMCLTDDVLNELLPETNSFENYVIPEFMCLTDDVLNELLPETNSSEYYVVQEFMRLNDDVLNELLPEKYSFGNSQPNFMPFPDKPNKIGKSPSVGPIEGNRYAFSDNIVEQGNSFSSSYIANQPTEPCERKRLRSSEKNIKCNSTENPNIMLPKQSDMQPTGFEHSHSKNPTGEKKYAEIFQTKVINEMENNSGNMCQNYKSFLSLIPELYLEIDNEFGITINNNVVYDSMNKTLSRENYTEVILKEIKSYESVVIDADMIPGILLFANTLLNFEKMYLADLEPYQILQFEDSMTVIIEKIKNHRNLGMFYELLKFVYYYQKNIFYHIEKNCILYVYFILAVISKQLNNFNDDFSILFKKCFKSEKGHCYNNTINKYLKKLYVQKVFSKLLLGMENGIIMAKFYNVYLSLEICWKSNHNTHFFNQILVFRFYLRVLISLVLICGSKLEIESLNNFINLSFEIFVNRGKLKDKFIQELKILIKDKNIINFLIKENLLIISKLTNKQAQSDCINNWHNMLQENIKKGIDLSFQNIFKSEVCLSCYLSMNYRNNNFEMDKNSNNWQYCFNRIFKK
ncbi:hypothetical protein CWI36_0649p0010 [Hamiltosporidium magnivora]|uniref:Uncharacterized protein n=1 Tax=Hamiltosporidium magnivora TaxID=148818 RepID=A0A4V2JVS9_9MICR|nr:hypothetical protein CWI36_0649p0010 [Hamiltosporidium magnivora]